MKRYLRYFAHGFFFALGAMAATIPISLLLLFTGVMKPGPGGTVAWSPNIKKAAADRDNYQLERDAKKKVVFSDLNILKKDGPYSTLIGNIENPSAVKISFHSFTLLFYKNNELVGSINGHISEDLDPMKKRRFTDTIKTEEIPGYDRIEIINK